MTTQGETAARLTLIRGGLDIDAELLESARRWARFNRSWVDISAIRFMLGEGERWIVIHWADGQHLLWHLDGHDGWRDPPPWDEEHSFDRAVESDGDEHNKAEDFIVCPECGQAFDAHDPYDALRHGWPGHRPQPWS